MSQSIDVKFLATTETQSIRANISTETDLIDTYGSNIAIALEKMALQLLGTECQIYSMDNEDDCETFSRWVYRDNLKTGSYSVYSRDDDTDRSTPEWYKPFPIDREENTLICYKNKSSISIEVSGFTDLLEVAKVLSQHLYSQDINPDYIQYSDTHVLTAYGKIAVISELSEEIQKKVFGIEPVWVDATDTLFSPTLHPELVAIYGNIETAKRGYKLGEFALWMTAEKTYFYANWRKTNHPSYFTFRQLKMKEIEGVYSSENVVYNTALKNFRKDAVICETFGREEQLFEDNWKISMVNGKLTKSYFSIQDYFPI